MWLDFLDKNRFLLSLYNEIPDLKKVEILQFRIDCDRNNVELVFVMPRYGDNPPEKWKEKNCNLVLVEIDFVAIKNLKFKLNCSNYIGDIDIFVDEKGLVNLSIKGDINVSLLAELGFIQKVEGYCLNGA
ncbi:MAG: immunity 50 family protein [Lachnospiraceae bacterium]|nr:immunity 50 family protein [Lachnospiraceae bacterium]